VAAWNDLVDPQGAKAFKSVDFTGGALVNGVTVDRFEVETNNGRKRVYFVHLDTGHLLRLDVYSEFAAYWQSIYYGDWRNAGGLNRPYKATIWERKKHKLVQTYVYESIQKS